MPKPSVYILSYGKMDKITQPILSGAMGLHVTSGLVVYEKDNATKGMVIDPGMVADWERHQEMIKKSGLKIEDISHVLITHLHQDHIQNLASYPKGTHVFHYGVSSILGSSEYGAKVYVEGSIELAEIKFEKYSNTHSQKDTVYIIDSANEGVVAFTGDLAFSLFDEMSKESQKCLDKGASVDPEKRWQVMNDFYSSHSEVEGFYLGHSGKKVNREELSKYLEEWRK